MCVSNKPRIVRVTKHIVLHSNDFILAFQTDIKYVKLTVFDTIENR